jgi:hypothetical protein
MPLTIFLKTCFQGTCTAISFVDSTPVRVCKNKRIKANKVFKGIATVGKSTMGWFYDFKLHIAIKDRGEIINFMIPQGNMDDSTPLKTEGFLKKYSENFLEIRDIYLKNSSRYFLPIGYTSLPVYVTT